MLDKVIDTPYIHTTFSSIVKQLRKDNNISQSELARYLHISRFKVSDIEHGRRRISYKQVELLATRFNIDTQSLLLKAGYISTELNSKILNIDIPKLVQLLNKLN